MKPIKRLGQALIMVGCSQTVACTELRDPTDEEYAILEKAVTVLNEAAPIEHALADQAEGGRKDMGEIIDQSNELLTSALAEKRFVIFDAAGIEHEGMGGFVDPTAGEDGKPRVAILADLLTKDVSMVVDTLRHESVHGVSEDYLHSSEVQDAVADLVVSNAALEKVKANGAGDGDKAYQDAYKTFLADVQELATTAIEKGDAAYLSGSISSLAAFPQYYNERIADKLRNDIQAGHVTDAQTEYEAIFSSQEAWQQATDAGYEEWSNDYPGMDQIIWDVTKDLKLESGERQAAFSFDTSFYEQGKAEGEQLLREADEASGERHRERRR